MSLEYNVSAVNDFYRMCHGVNSIYGPIQMGALKFFFGNALNIIVWFLYTRENEKIFEIIVFFFGISIIFEGPQNMKGPGLLDPKLPKFKVLIT